MKTFKIQIQLDSLEDANECRKVIGGMGYSPCHGEFGVTLETDDATEAMGFINDANNWMAFNNKRK